MKIVFKMYPQRSHYNGVFHFASSLAKAGHDIIFCGAEDLKNHVLNKGFRFHVCFELYPLIEDEPREYSPSFWRSIWNGHYTLIDYYRYLRETKRIWLKNEFFNQIIDEIEPDFCLIDSPYALFTLELQRLSVPYGIVETMMPQDKASNCPPFNTIFVPNESKISHLICEILWMRYFIKRWLLGFMRVRIDNNPRLVRKMANKNNVPISRINKKRYFHVGIRNAPEFLLAPHMLDFKRELKPNQVPIKFNINLNRSETHFDYSFQEQFDKMVGQKPEKPLVYCSLGTAGWRYIGAMRFLQRVIAASMNAEWNLILGFGSFARVAFSDSPDNVAVFKFVPQLKVLKSADLMITHAGMNSLAECVAIGVPMLLYPGCMAIDQGGNAARMVYHGVGKVGDMRRDRKEKIASDIRDMLRTKSYKENADKAREALLNDSIGIKVPECFMEFENVEN